MMKNRRNYIRFWIAVVIVAAITSVLQGQDTNYNIHLGGNHVQNDTIYLYPDGSDWYHGQDTTAQDTIPVTIHATDTTYRPDLWYYVEDPDDSTIFDSNNISNEYREVIPGWMVNGQVVTLRFEPLEPKYKILNIEGREWYTLTGETRQEISEPGSTTTIYSEEIYFQQPGHFKNE